MTNLDAAYQRLKDENAALRKINSVLMRRVERSLDMGESTYALFERTVVLEDYVRQRTEDLEQSQARLQNLLVEQNRIKEHLRYNEEMLRQLTETMTEVFWLRTADHKQILYVNPAYQHVFGRSCQSLYDDPSSFLQCITAEDQSRIMQAFIEYERNHQFNEDYRIVCPNGTIRWISARSFPVRDEFGTIIRHAGIAVDITERKQAELALAEEKAGFEALFQESPISIIIHDPQSGAIQDANPAAIAAYGCSDLQELQAQEIYTTTPYSAQEALELIHLAAKSGPQSIEWRSQRCDGTIFWEQVTLSLVTLNGKPCVLSSSIDISQRKEAEERLRLLSRAVMQSPAGIVITNTECIIESINPAVEVITGYREDELLGASPRLFQSGETPKTVYQDLWSTISDGRIWNGEFHNRHKDGRLYWEAATIGPVRNGAGVITHFIAFKQDITQRKQMLEDLQQAKLKADAANQAKSEFLANISHEIRTPMNGVMGMAELLLGSKLDVTQQEWARTIIASAEQQLAIVNDVLEFSRLDSGKMPIERQRFDLPDMLYKLIQPYVQRLASDEVALLLQIQPKLPQWHWGDASRLRQIMSNLISNAVKFTEQGFIVVTAEADHQHLILSVEDSGMGISAHYKAALFQPFEQADNSISRRFGGSGLGLAICKRLCEAMGGTITLDSYQGQGSTFTILLPLDIHPQQDPGHPFSQPRPLAGQSFFLISDLERSATIIANAINAHEGKLCQPPLIATAATPGSLPAEPDALIIIDGSATFCAAQAEHLRQRHERRTICWLARQNNPEHRERAWRNGCQGYLALPQALPELIPFLKRLSSQPQTSLLTREDLQLAPKQEQPQRSNLLQEKRVLIAEDNSVNQTVLAAMLKTLGCKDPIIASNGQQAVDAFCQQRPDLVLMDVQMPEMDGLQATTAIRSWELTQKAPHTPIIAITANAMEGDRQRYLACDMDEYLSKPFKKEQLSRTIAKVMLSRYPHERQRKD